MRNIFKWKKKVSPFQFTEVLYNYFIYLINQDKGKNVNFGLDKPYQDRMFFEIRKLNYFLIYNFISEKLNDEVKNLFKEMVSSGIHNYVQDSYIKYLENWNSIISIESNSTEDNNWLYSFSKFVFNNCLGKHPFNIGASMIIASRIVSTTEGLDAILNEYRIIK